MVSHIISQQKMTKLSYILYSLLALTPLNSVIADSKTRHHSLGPSHKNNDTHTRVPRNHVKPETEHGNHHKGSHNDVIHHHKRHGHRKAGSLSQRASLLGTLEAPVCRCASQSGNTPDSVTAPAVVADANRSKTMSTQTDTANNNETSTGSNNQEPPKTISTEAATSTNGKNQASKENITAKEGNKDVDGSKPSDIICKYLWFLFRSCNSSAPVVSTEPQPSENKTGSATDDQALSPVVSSACTIYGTTVLSLSDFKDAEEGGWILMNESNSPRITHNKQVNADKPAQLELKNVLCNAATYEATIKLGVESSGGFTIRGSDQNLIVFEMNTLSKTATLKSINGPYQDIISDVPFDQINSQFVQKVQIRDTGYKGQIEVQIDGKRVISAIGLPFRSSGLFGLYISQGNATFGDISVLPLKE